jgi:drug/metabolite transporter (DMT)-like permease
MLSKTTIGAIIISLLYGIAAIPAALLAKKAPYPIIMLMTSSVYFFIVFMYYSRTPHKLSNIKLDMDTVSCVLILAILCTWMPNVIYYYIINEKNTTLVSAVSSIYPIWTLIFSYIFLTSHTKITYSLLTGIILIIVGVIMVSKE